MYYELIYTRCGEGVDIQTNCSPITNIGFKVFACTQKITETGLVDIPLLDATAHSKESYAEPDFMDDAYLFIVPDFGQKYLSNFHPIPFNKTYKPGNFINQIFVGAFDDFYPYELFGNETVWDAQKRGEAFYYENAPIDLPPRKILNDGSGAIHFDDIAAFVADGRREVLMSAIAFIVSQYTLLPEERKFLLIRDENAQQIELWIAAIECAFSPRMASNLSFATRLNRFSDAVKYGYAVDINRKYQQQVNFQDPNQKFRIRAMIVGVDERDKINVGNIKVMPHAPYVVLDGKSKTLSVDMDTQHPYYQDVTLFDEKHNCLCREFMQMLGVSSPSDKVFQLHTAFVDLSKYRLDKQSKDLLSALSILQEYPLVKTDYLEKLHQEIKQTMPTLLKEDAVSSFVVMKWLEHSAAVVGDESLHENFCEMICSCFADNLFCQPKDDNTRKFQEAINGSLFAKAVATYLALPTTIATYSETTNAYQTQDWLAFTELWIGCLKNNGDDFSQVVKTLFAQSIQAAYLAHDHQNAVAVVSCYFAYNQRATVDALLCQAHDGRDEDFREFLMSLVCHFASQMMSSESHLSELYQQFQQFHLEKYFITALEHKAQSLHAVYDMEMFLAWILANSDCKNIELSSILSVLDRKLLLSDKTAQKLALQIQTHKPQGLVCINSAHIVALDMLDVNHQGRATALLDSVVAQGFPCLKDDAYATRLMDKLFDVNLPKKTFATLVSVATESSYYANKIANEAMRYIKTKKKFIVGELIEIATKINSQTWFDALVVACANIRRFDKGMLLIREVIHSQSARKYFAQIEKEARQLYEQKKKPSLFARLFTRQSK